MLEAYIRGCSNGIKRPALRHRLTSLLGLLCMSFIQTQNLIRFFFVCVVVVVDVDVVLLSFFIRYFSLLFLFFCWIILFSFIYK